MSMCLLLLLNVAAPAQVVECRSVGGHVNGQAVSATRVLSLHDSQLTLAGDLSGKHWSGQHLRCERLDYGIWCGGRSGQLMIQVVAHEKRLIEKITHAETGEELAGIAYVCDGALTW